MIFGSALCARRLAVLNFFLYFFLKMVCAVKGWCMMYCEILLGAFNFRWLSTIFVNGECKIHKNMSIQRLGCHVFRILDLAFNLNEFCILKWRMKDTNSLGQASLVSD